MRSVPLLTIASCGLEWLLAAAISQPAFSAKSSSESQFKRIFNNYEEDRFLDQANGGFCAPCHCEFNLTNISMPITAYILTLNSPSVIDMIKWNARDFEKYKNGTVKFEIRTTDTLSDLYQEIESDAQTNGGLYDAYFTNPVVLGTAAMLKGLVDLGPYVKDSSYADWTDILNVFRTYVTEFEDIIYLILLDGDTHSMFYRRDILEYFNLSVPRTWNEYNAVAKAVHGKVYDNITLSGSCVSRKKDDYAQYWAHLVLASVTQTQGPQTGSLFDTKDMNPLTGKAMAEMLRIHEEMARYGVPDEFVDDLLTIQSGHINDGSCVLTYGWGDLYRRSRAQGSAAAGKFGISPTPGSQLVLDRKTGDLVSCSIELCPYATYYEDIGWVNYAPYAANGGWGGAISVNASPEKQQMLIEFLLWASGKDQSLRYVIPNASLPLKYINGQNPWRRSHLDVEKWVEHGYKAEIAKQYVDTILNTGQSKNVVVDIMFPKAGEIMSVLDEEVYSYLIRAVKDKSIPDNDLSAERLKTASSVTKQWNDIISTYDARGDTTIPILQLYQRQRGVAWKQDPNQIKTVRPIGYALFSVNALFAFACAVWVVCNWEQRVVKASQPPFLLLICFGSLVLSSCIIPLGIDDSIASDRGCDVACVATPWLAAIGFTIMFAALFSKIWRLNLVVENANHFRRVTVTVKDVIFPLIVLLTINVVLLTIWTVKDPPRWERIYDGRDASGTLESHGQCMSESSTSTVILSLLVIVNIAALLLANIQAYKARKISSEFSESKYIAFSMISLIEAFLIGTPVLILAKSNPNAHFLVGSLLAFICSISTQALIFIPKFRWSTMPSETSVPTNSAINGRKPLPNNDNLQNKNAKGAYSPEKKDEAPLKHTDLCESLPLDDEDALNEDPGVVRPPG